MQMKKLLAGMAVVAALASCATSNSALSTNGLNGKWTIVKIDGNNVTPDADLETPYLGFDVKTKHVYGSTSCNQLIGSFKANAKTGEIDLGEMGSTRMMCHDMQTEQSVLNALAKTKTYKLAADGSLLFADGTGKTVMELKKQ